MEVYNNLIILFPFISIIEDFLSSDLLHYILKYRNKNEKIFMYQIIKDHSMVPKIHVSERWLLEYDNMHFFMLFRMEKQSVEKLEGVLLRVDEINILRKKYTGGHHPVEPKLQILIFIYFMATQETLFGIGNRFKVSAVTVMNIVNRLLYFTIKLKKTYIKFPSNEEELQQTSREFKRYPEVVGALDGTHIFIKVEKEQQDSYIDRYRRHSINIMGICNASRLFLYIFVGFPGSAHDSRVFETSNFYRNIQQYGSDSIFLNKYHLIGDSAFGVKKWLMTPYRDNNNLTRVQKYHNYRLSSDRVVIEHAFGQLKGRWRRLQFINTYNICKTVEISTAACILHNFCILNCDLWDEYFFQERIANEDVGQLAAIQNEGKVKRDRIARELFYNVE